MKLDNCKDCKYFLREWFTNGGFIDYCEYTEHLIIIGLIKECPQELKSGMSETPNNHQKKRVREKIIKVLNENLGNSQFETETIHHISIKIQFQDPIYGWVEKNIRV